MHVRNAAISFCQLSKKIIIVIIQCFSGHDVFDFHTINQLYILKSYDFLQHRLAHKIIQSLRQKHHGAVS